MRVFVILLDKKTVNSRSHDHDSFFFSFFFKDDLIHCDDFRCYDVPGHDAVVLCQPHTLLHFILGVLH